MWEEADVEYLLPNIVIKMVVQWETRWLFWPELHNVEYHELTEFVHKVEAAGQ